MKREVAGGCDDMVTGRRVFMIVCRAGVLQDGERGEVCEEG